MPASSSAPAVNEVWGRFRAVARGKRAAAAARRGRDRHCAWCPETAGLAAIAVSGPTQLTLLCRGCREVARSLTSRFGRSAA